MRGGKDKIKSPRTPTETNFIMHVVCSPPPQNMRPTPPRLQSFEQTGGVKKTRKNNLNDKQLIRNPSYYILLFLLRRLAAYGGCGSGLTNNKDIWQKLMPMHQLSLFEFQRKFIFGMEDKKWQYKYRNRFVGVEKQRT